MKETILVTGGAGAIGSRLVENLVRDHRVLVLDDLSSGWFDNLRNLEIDFWRGSVTDDEILHEVFSENPTLVFHLAANFANQNSVDYPQKDATVNGLGTLKILEFSRKAKVKRFVYTSSSCVYGNYNEPINEEMVGGKLDTPYAISKLTGEHYVQFFHDHHQLPTTILRLFNSYGPGEYPGKYRNVIPNFIYLAMNGQPLRVTGTGEETRDYTYIDDTIQALKLCMSRDEAIGQIFNTGTGIETSTNELIRSLKNTLPVEMKVCYQHRRNWDSIARRRSDITKISNILGYHPKTILEEGIQRTVKWFLKNEVNHFRFYN